MLQSRSATRAALSDLRRTRLRHRLEDRTWIDTLYKAYLTVIAGFAAVIYLSPLFGSGDLSGESLTDVRERGPAALGVVVALAIALALRSGARGGPLAPEPPDIVYVLMAPLRRDTALRALAIRQLRGVLFVGLVGGIAAGVIAFARLPENGVQWVIAGSVLGVVVALSAWGAALIASGRRCSMRTATLVGVGLVVWSVADFVVDAQTSPITHAARAGVWPLEWSIVPVAALSAALVLPVVGFFVVGGVSIERAEHRARLVSQLRFAATVHDVRAVMSLHRQLAQEAARARPWRRVRLDGSRLGGCWRRDWQGVMRWPASRALRNGGLCALAGLALVGVWNGASALVVVAGAALFIAGLDAAEGLAAEADNLDRAAGYPVPWGTLVVRHLATPLVVLACFAPAAALVVAAGTGSGIAVGIGAVSLTVAVGAAVVGAATMLVLGAPEMGAMYYSDFGSFMVLARQGFPLALVIGACAPLALYERNDPEVRTALAFGAAGFVFVVVLGVVGWLRTHRLTGE